MKLYFQVYCRAISQKLSSLKIVYSSSKKTHFACSKLLKLLCTHTGCKQAIIS